ncbi:uncharacterized protein LOC117319189 [Pecten maximus]|uniref:uncharacterized protein LOC117319189 n=1 Tax=Pecten maximus TaxID=6579 RepID=UPI00145867EC|nr:uncharacterized protein LOC117319189 [Pecten maximus]
MEKAIQASLEEFRGGPKEEKSLDLILSEFCEKNLIQEQTRILVYRRRVLESAFKAFARPSFRPEGKLNIKLCEGELGEDYGGPKREFLRLALEELSNSNMFKWRRRK